MADIGTLPLLNRPAESEAGGSGAAAAEWPGPVSLRYCVSAHSTHEFNEEFIQILHVSVCSSWPGLLQSWIVL